MIEIENLSLTLGKFHLSDITFSIKEGEYFVILGPTAAGKSILIECIAGLHKIKSGQIRIDGRDVTRLAPEEREVGYVPQDYVLFPFLNVKRNIEFGLRRNTAGKADRVNSLVNLMGISHLLGRDVRSLSGGEKQRVSLARAMVTSPRVLLLDEPFSALDLQTSKHLRLELKGIHRELGVTMVHITHDQSEAEEMADRIGILNKGRLEQVGRPEEVFFYPNSETVSGFIGTPNILECDSFRSLGRGLAEVDCGGLCIILPHDGNKVKRIALSPRDIYVSNTEPPGPDVNLFKGFVNDITISATVVRLSIKVGKHTFLAEVPPDVHEEMNLSPGSEVYLKFRLRRIRVYEDNGDTAK